MPLAGESSGGMIPPAARAPEVGAEPLSLKTEYKNFAGQPAPVLLDNEVGRKIVLVRILHSA